MKRFIIFYCFLAIVLLHSCKEPNPNEIETPEPQVLNSGITYTNTISALGEVHRYLYKPKSNHYVHIVCTEALQYSEFNPHIKLLDYPTQHVLSQATSYTQAVIVNYNVEAGKSYEIQVREWSDDRTGGYTLLIEQDFDDEKTLIINQDRTGKINYIKDNDDFILNISEVGYYHISVREKIPYSDFNPHISLLDFATKFSLDQKTSYTEAVLVNKNLGQNPSYWIRVQEWSDDQPGEYVIKYMKDPDDSLTFTNVPVFYIGSIEFIGDIDKLYFRPNSTRNYKIVLSEKIPYSEFNPHLRIFGEFNNLLQTKAAYDSVVININLEAFKTYGIEAREWSDDREGEYVLKIE